MSNSGPYQATTLHERLHDRHEDMIQEILTSDTPTISTTHTANAAKQAHIARMQCHRPHEKRLTRLAI